MATAVSMSTSDGEGFESARIQISDPQDSHDKGPNQMVFVGGIMSQAIAKPLLWSKSFFIDSDLGKLAASASCCRYSYYAKFAWLYHSLQDLG